MPLDGDAPFDVSNAPATPLLTAFVAVAAFLNISLDPEQLSHSLGVPAADLSPGDLLRLAKRLEIRAKLASSRIDRIDRLPLPALALRKDGTCMVLLQAHVVDQQPAGRWLWTRSRPAQS